MGLLEDTCRDLLSSVDAAIACGVLNLDSGCLSAMSRAPTFSADFDDVLASAVADVFLNESVARIDAAAADIMSDQRQDLSGAQELLVMTANSYQFARRLGPSHAILLFIATHETNIGLAWAQMRAALPEFQHALAISEPPSSHRKSTARPD